MQVTAVQVVALYGAETSWHGQKGWCDEFQRLVNGQRRVVTGIFQTPPKVVVVRETWLWPAVFLVSN